MSDSFAAWLKDISNMERLGDFGTALIDAGIAMIPRLIGAAIILFVGWMIAKFVTSSVRKVLGKTCGIAGTV